MLLLSMRVVKLSLRPDVAKWCSLENSTLLFYTVYISIEFDCFTMKVKISFLDRVGCQTISNWILVSTPLMPVSSHYKSI